MNNAEVLVKFKGDISSLDKTTKLAKTSILDIAKGVSLGTLAVQGVTKAVSLFNQGLDGAIARSDTMRNFPKVMDNLGISAEDATEVVNDLSEKLRGLPTALDRASQSVQRLTTKTGDVKEAERIFLAVNNAILAGGASSEIQASAMEQLSQAFAKGKPDMVEWRSLLTAMPAQLKQVATAMGYTSVEALGSIVRSKDGAEEFTKMINMMVQMNETGVAGFKSFEEQARSATSGISTSVTNMKTAIVRGVANLLTSVNDATQRFGGISGILSTIGKTAETMFTKVGEILSWTITKLFELYNWYLKNKIVINAVAIVIGAFVATCKTISIVVGIINGVKTAFMLLHGVILANPITILVALIAGLVASFIYLWNNCEAFRNFWITLWEGIKVGFQATIDFFKGLLNGAITFIQSIPTTILNVINSIITFIGKIPYYIGYVLGYIIGLIYIFFNETIPNAIASFIEFLLTIPGKIGEIIDSIFSFIGKIPEFLYKIWINLKAWFFGLKEKAINSFKNFVSEIIGVFTGLPGKMKDIGKNIIEGVKNGIKGAKDKAIGAVKDVGKGLLDGLKNVLGIHSPSKEFAILGHFSVLGYTEALDEMSDTVDKQIQDTFGLSPNLTNSASLHYSPNVVVNNDINVSQDPLGQMVSNIKSFSGGAKNDYSFGLGE